MTRQRSFKRLVRARMEKTGESYTAARAALLGAEGSVAGADGSAAGAEGSVAGATESVAGARESAATVVGPATGARPALATSDDAIRRRTGRGWEEWFDLLDEWGAAERSHREIARWVADQQGVVPLAWNAQAVAGSYERTRGLRAVGEHADGFAITASKTVAVPVDQLYDAFVDASLRERWLPDAELRERTASKPKTAHFDWSDGPSRVHVAFVSKGDAKSTAALQHARLADADEAERMKRYWRDRVATLKEVLER